MSETIVEADLLISGATLITMNAQRHVILDGALAIAGDRIVAVGKREALARTVRAKETMDGRRFVVTPGFVDAHIHITADPITRGFRRGAPEDSWSDKLNKWVIPIFHAQTAKEERIAAQVAALIMLRYGTTCFMEAGTVRQLDAVMEGLEETGIRGRVGEWVEGRAYNPAADQAKMSADAIAILESEVERYPDDGLTKLACWPILVGHSTNSDDVWRAAKRLADDKNIRVSAHMSPRIGDPTWFLQKYNRRPVEHLADIGVLGSNVALTHLASIDTSELDTLVETGTHAIHCAHAAFLGAMGLTKIGLYPEMIERGVNVMLGTDGFSTDILSSARIMAAGFRDARDDQDSFPPTLLLEMATINGAKGMGMDGVLGSLEAGKKADFVLHDADLPEWGPMFDPVGQLAIDAPPSGVHSAWVDGVKVLEDGHSTMIDEAKLIADSKQAGLDVIARTGLPNRPYWPVI
jgi:cytosine/adenosine deaminase-related metal-dependent hydrolase